MRRVTISRDAPPGRFSERLGDLLSLVVPDDDDDDPKEVKFDQAPDIH